MPSPCAPWQTTQGGAPLAVPCTAIAAPASCASARGPARARDQQESGKRPPQEERRPAKIVGSTISKAAQRYGSNAPAERSGNRFVPHLTPIFARRPTPAWGSGPAAVDAS